MRRFFCAALALFAIPAFAQDAPRAEHDAEIVIEDDDGPIRLHIERDGPRVLFRGEDGERVFNLDMPELEHFNEFRFRGEAPFAMFRDGSANRFFNVLGSGSVSSETRERMRELQAESRELAMQARTLDGTERQDAERQLDAVLSELFEVRGQARQEEADALRERARELMAEAEEKEASLLDRAARRQALIDARRAEMLGTPSSDW